jgi:outer membrane immunogenic protein
MKKLVLALTAVAAMTVSASAADLAARPYSKAPMMAAPIYNWTGFYIFGGGGYGLFESEDYTRDISGFPLTTSNRMGGHGYFGTVGAGYDMQFAGSWVAGVFADGQFGSIKGTLQDPETLFGSGQYKNTTNVAVGARIGYLVAPNVLSYVNGGYSYAQFSGTNLYDLDGDGTFEGSTNRFSRNGWFLGGGVENSFGFLGTGWFMKTEYRVAEYQRRDVPLFDTTGLATGNSISTRPIVQTVSSSLVYRFNWGGPIVAKY